MKGGVGVETTSTENQNHQQSFVTSIAAGSAGPGGYRLHIIAADMAPLICSRMPVVCLYVVFAVLR